MPLTGAEKQRRYIQRLKAAAGAAPLEPDLDPEEVAQLLLAIAARVREIGKWVGRNQRRLASAERDYLAEKATELYEAARALVAKLEKQRSKP